MQAITRRRMEGISEVIQRRRWREADARLVLKASQESGASPSGFARECGLQPPRIWRWTARLTDQSSESVLFHPVRLVEPHHGNRSPAAVEGALLSCPVATGAMQTPGTRRWFAITTAIACACFSSRTKFNEANWRKSAPAPLALRSCAPR